MKKTFICFLLTAFAFLILFTFQRCRKNAMVTPSARNTDAHGIYGLSVAEAKLFYETRQSSSAFFRNKSNEAAKYFKIKRPYWDRAINALDSNYYIVEAPVVFDQSPGFIISGTNTSGSTDQPNDVARLLILKNKRTGEMHSALMHIVSDNGTEELSITYNKRSSHFSGFIFYTDIEGHFINGWKYENGKITRKSSKGAGMKKKTGKRVGTGPAVALMAPPDAPPVDCSTYTITVYIRDCEYYPSGEKNCTPWRIEDQYEQTYCTGGGGSSGGIGGDVYNENESDEANTQWDNAHIIDTSVDLCAKNVMKDWRDNVKFGIANMYNDYEATLQGNNVWEYGNFNLNFIMGKTLPQGYAETNPNIIGNNIVIKIDTTYAKQASDIAILTTIIHESFHAYYVYLFNDPSTRDKAIQQFGQQFGTDGGAQHDYMVTTYINQIAGYLQEYCIFKGYNISKNYLSDIAWAGLTQTGAFQRLSTQDQIRIINRCLAEIGVGNTSDNPETRQGRNPCITIL